MPRRTTDFRGLAQASRLRVLGAVQDRPGCTLREVADATGLHLNTAREHLATLEREGLVSASPRPGGTRGRPPMTWTPVDDPVDNPAARERVERAREHGEVLRRLRPERPRADGLGTAARQQLDVLYEHFEDAGLEPVIDEASLLATLVPCPYHRVLEEDRELACAVHSRLVSDTLAQVPGPVELAEILPLVGPHTCLVRLRIASTAAQPAGAGRAAQRQAMSDPAARFE